MVAAQKSVGTFLKQKSILMHEADARIEPAHLMSAEREHLSV